MHGSELVSMDGWLRSTKWDDERRFQNLKPMLTNKRILDFGCGAGGFMQKAAEHVASIEGIELEQRVQEFWSEKFKIHSDIESASENYDVITAFHVIEHLHDPVQLLSMLANKLSQSGKMVIEVPSANDALLTFYDSDAFQRFTYWSQHLYLFTPSTLSKVLENAGLRVSAIQQYQRYPLSNHLYWLSNSSPGGHEKWSFLDNPALHEAYSQTLAQIGKCDTLIAFAELND
jgi:cyclopropane fatty-acyl-phospholipid synthase-like methyltransferase